MEVPTGMMALGVPAKLRVASSKLDVIAIAARDYAEKGRYYRDNLRRLD
jgi:hypothetical protein